jgi:hypothetical protein
MGPEMVFRTFDKLDFIFFPIVLFFRVSPLAFALARYFIKLVHQFYDYFFNQALFKGVHHEVLPTTLSLFYLGIKFVMVLLYWMHIITSFALSFPFKLWQELLFGHGYFIVFTIPTQKVGLSGR